MAGLFADDETCEFEGNEPSTGDLAMGELNAESLVGEVGLCGPFGSDESLFFFFFRNPREGMRKGRVNVQQLARATAL